MLHSARSLVYFYKYHPAWIIFFILHTIHHMVFLFHLGDVTRAHAIKKIHKK